MAPVRYPRGKKKVCEAPGEREKERERAHKWKEGRKEGREEVTGILSERKEEAERMDKWMRGVEFVCSI